MSFFRRRSELFCDKKQKKTADLTKSSQKKLESTERHTQLAKKKKETSARPKDLPKGQPSRTPSFKGPPKKSPDPYNGDIGVGSNLFGVGSGVGAPRLLLQEDSHPGDLGVGSVESALQTSSRLNKTLHEFVHDRDAISHLIHYLESRKSAQLIRFWLDAESFQAATWTRIRTQSLNTVSKSSLVKTRTENQKESPTFTRTENVASSPDRTGNERIPVLISENHIQTNQNSDAPELEKNGQEETSKLETSTELHSKQESNLHSSCHTSTKDDDPRAREKCKVVDGENENRVECENHVRGSISSTTMVSESGQLEVTESKEEARTLNLQESAIVDSSSDGNKSETSTGVHNVVETKYNLAEKLKKSIEQDAVRIFQKYLSQDATHPIGVMDNLRNECIHKICREDGAVDPACFCSCQEFALDKINKEHYSEFLSSSFHAKHQVDILTSGKVYLADILYNDTALFYFMEYMEQEGASHLLQFWIGADNFQQTLTSHGSHYDGMQAQEDAMVLYDKYFSLQAAHPLGFTDTIRFEVEGNICREEGPLPDCFAKPRDIVLHSIEKLYFPKYLQSNIYYKYLSELVGAVQAAQEFPVLHRKRAGSESSSEHSVGSQSVGGESISSKNTLLAVGSSRPKSVSFSKLDQAMTMDPGLLNPDSLWQRPDQGLSSVGKMDKFGQFVSGLSPNPDIVEKKPSGSRFFKKKKDKEKEQEEMARKVAEMIISDVTSVTQAISAIKNEGQESQQGQ